MRSSYPRRNELEITRSNKELLNSILLRRSQISTFRDFLCDADQDGTAAVTVEENGDQKITPLTSFQL